MRDDVFYTQCKRPRFFHRSRISLANSGKLSWYGFCKSRTPWPAAIAPPPACVCVPWSDTGAGGGEGGRLLSLLSALAARLDMTGLEESVAATAPDVPPRPERPAVASRCSGSSVPPKPSPVSQIGCRREMKQYRLCVQPSALESETLTVLQVKTFFDALAAMWATRS